MCVKKYVQNHSYDHGNLLKKWFVLPYGKNIFIHKIENIFKFLLIDIITGIHFIEKIVSVK